MQMQDRIQKKIRKIIKVENDLKYLRDMYQSMILRREEKGERIPFETLIAWLAENEEAAESMLKVAKELKEI